jgi:glycosyltransferase involved in cell wall biosynthesis
MKKSARPRVICRLEMPTPYFVERFNTIAQRGNVEIHGWFDAVREPDRSWDVVPAEWQFAGRYTHPTLLGPARELWTAQPDVYVTAYKNASYLAAMLAARATGARTVLRVLKTFDTWVTRSRAKELAKHAVFRLADGVQTSGPDGAAYSHGYGARRLFAFPEPIDVARFQAGSAATRLDPEARRRLSLEGCVFLYVGRLWRSKGLEYLIEAFRRLREEGVSASLLLVGDGVDEAYLRSLAARVPGVVFAGYAQQDALPRYYGLSDVFVFPTLGDPYGHVVHEAMASSVPVISTESAGDIRQRVEHGVSGFLTPPADPASLYESMRRLALDPALRRSMAAEGFKVVEGRTIDWWAGNFEDMVYALLEGRAGARRPDPVLSTK